MNDKQTITEGTMMTPDENLTDLANLIDLIKEEGDSLTGGDPPEKTAGEWLSVFGSAATVADWIGAGAWDPHRAAKAHQAGLTPEDAFRYVIDVEYRQMTLADAICDGEITVEQAVNAARTKGTPAVRKRLFF